MFKIGMFIAWNVGGLGPVFLFLWSVEGVQDRYVYSMNVGGLGPVFLFLWSVEGVQDRYVYSMECRGTKNRR